MSREQRPSQPLCNSRLVICAQEWPQGWSFFRCPAPSGRGRPRFSSDCQGQLENGETWPWLEPRRGSERLVSGTQHEVLALMPTHPWSSRPRCSKHSSSYRLTPSPQPSPLSFCCFLLAQASKLHLDSISTSSSEDCCSTELGNSSRCPQPG